MANDGFDIKDDELLCNNNKEMFYTIVAKGLYTCKRAIPDIYTTIIYLTTKINDMIKLHRLTRYIN